MSVYIYSQQIMLGKTSRKVAFLLADTRTELLAAGATINVNRDLSPLKDAECYWLTDGPMQTAELQGYTVISDAAVQGIIDTYNPI